MSKNAALMLTLTLLGIAPAHAINAKFAQQLERSGCTQVTETQGCDIHKTKAENAKAGFGAAPTADTSASPYAGEWVATFPETGATVATISIDGKDRVLVNGKQVKAKNLMARWCSEVAPSLIPFKEIVASRGKMSGWIMMQAAKE